MPTELISVVVPVYNAETTIEKCIDSLLAQTYSNIELILVDDGSLDGSGGICKRYAEADKRVRYIRKENGGVSSARNRGIDEAKGAYISFCDSDDWFEENAIESLYNAAKTYDCEYVIPRCRGYHYSVDGILEKVVCDNDSFFACMSAETFAVDFHKYYDSNLCYSTGCRLYKICFLRQHQIYFDEKMNVLEDFNFNLQCFSFASKVVHITPVLYNYIVVNQKEYGFKRNNIEALKRSVQTVYCSFENLFACKSIPFEQKYYNFILSYWILTIQNVLHNNEKEKAKQIHEICTEISSKNLYEKCKKENIDTSYKVLFKTKSLFLFKIVKTLKKWKARWRK